MYTNMADVPVPGIRKCWRQKLAWLKTECHAITYKYAEAVSIVQQVNRVLNNIENLTAFAQARVRVRSQLSSVEKNRGNCCGDIDGKPLFSYLYGIYTVTRNELKAALKMSARAG
jgi:hypothetical protein